MLGAAILELLAHPRRWVRRRVETIELIDAITQERAVSIELDLLSEPADLVIPVTVVRKEGVAVDIRTESNTPLATLSDGEREFVSWSILAAAAAQTAGPGRVQTLDHGLLEALRRIVTSAPEKARAIVDDLVGGTDPSRNAPESAELFRAVATALADGFLLLARPDAGSPGRIVLRMQYRDAIQSPRGGFGRWPGWSAKPFVFPVPGAGPARLHQFEVIAPQDLQVVEASLWSDSSLPIASSAHAVDGGAVVRLDVDVERDDPPAHLAVSLGPRRKGVLRTCLASTATHALLFMGGLWHLSRGEPLPDASLAGLALAGVTSLLVSHEPRDSLAGRLLAGPRRCAGLSGVLSLAAAAGVVFATPDTVVRSAWAVFVLVAVVSFAAVAAAYRNAKSKPAWRGRRGGRDELAAAAEGNTPLPSLPGIFFGTSFELGLPLPRGRHPALQRRERALPGL